MSLPEWIGELKQRHVSDSRPDIAGHCVYCNDNVHWHPCDVHRLIEYIEQQDAENQRLREAVEAADALADAIADYHDGWAKWGTVSDVYDTFRATRTSDEGG